MIKPLPSIPGTSASRKPLYIGLIVIALVVVLVLVYFGTKQFAGQAGSTGSTGTLTERQAGITGTTTGIGTLTVDIGANIGAASSVAFDFVLNYPADALEYVSVTPAVLWGADAFERITPSSEKVAYELATIDYTQAVDSTTPLAKVTFNVRRALTPADYSALTFSSFHVYNLENDGDIITSIVGGSEGEEIQQCTEAQCRTDNPNMILRSECIASTQEECLSTYNDLILQSNCPAGTAVGDTACTGYYNNAANSAQKDVLCGAWLDTLDAGRLTTELSTDQITALCGAGATQGFNADLNGDENVDNDDVTIMQLALEAKDPNIEPQHPCGGVRESYCNFNSLIWVCEDLKNTISNPGGTQC